MRHSNLRPLIGPAALAVAGFALRAAAAALARWTGLEAEGDTAGVLRDLGGVAGWLALAWGGARLFDILLLRAAAATRRDTPYPRLLGDLVRAVLFLAAAAAIVILVFGRPAVGLITTSSVAIAVIGFALRNILGDVFSGVALNFDNPYRIGDWIETAEGCAGRVTEISWRATRLVTRDGVAQIVPNGLIAGHRLVNYGNAEGEYRAALRVPLDPALPPERARRILLAGALDAGRGIPGLAPSVILHEMAEGTAVYLVRFQVPNYEREAPCRDAVAGAVLRALQAIGLGIARPARETHLARRAPAAARPRRQALLRRIELFRAFTTEERAELEQLMRERVLPRGASIVREGEAGRSLFVLAEGALDVTHARDGQEVALDRMVPGDVFGEMSLLTGQPRSASVTAATEAVVFEVDKADLDALLQRRPELAEGLATIMANREAHNASRQRTSGRSDAPDPPGRDALLRRLRGFFGLG